MKITKYPFYMYNRNGEEPKRVDNHGEMIDLENQGWTTAYIHREYPKWVNGVIVQNKEDHDLLVQNEVMVKKERVLIHPTNGTVENSEDFPFCLFDADGKFVEGKEYKTWPEAKKAQGIMNSISPGHKAGKKNG